MTVLLNAPKEQRKNVALQEGWKCARTRHWIHCKQCVCLPANQKKTTLNADCRCSKCKELCHKCPSNKLALQIDAAVASDPLEQLRWDSAKLDLMDAMPFVDGDDEFF